MGDLVVQQNATIDSQRNQLAQQNSQLEAQRRQIEDLQRQLAAMQHQSSMQGGLHDQLRAAQDALSRANDEAARAQRELQSLREAQRRMQSENDALRDRSRRLEGALQQLQGDCMRQKTAAEAEIDCLVDEVSEGRKQAELSALKKELQMREVMQAELQKARSDAKRDCEKVRGDLKDAKGRLAACENTSRHAAKCRAISSGHCSPRGRTQRQQMQPMHTQHQGCGSCVPPPGHVLTY